MAIEYMIRMRDAFNNIVEEFRDIIEIDYARGVNRVGSMTLLLPPKYEKILGPVLPPLHRPLSFKRHYQFEVWRKSPDGVMYLEGNTSYLALRPARWVTKKNEKFIRIKAADPLWTLKTRIVAYDTDSPQHSQTLVAGDDVIKNWWRDAFTLQVYNPSARDLVTPGYLALAANTTSAPQISQEASWEELLTVMQDAADRTERKGTWVCFDYDCNGTGTFPWTFKTYLNRRGNDLSSGANMVLMGYWTGEVIDVPFEINYEDEFTFVYAGGPGVGATRLMSNQSDPVRIASSPFGRIEAFEQARQAKTIDEVSDAAAGRLEAGNPKRALTTEIEDTFRIQYGRDFFYGDQVAFDFDDERVIARMDSVHITFSEGQETKLFGWELVP